jgi:hypothetical protein
MNFAEISILNNLRIAGTSFSGLHFLLPSITEVFAYKYMLTYYHMQLEMLQIFLAGNCNLDNCFHGNKD